tara:strand:+ start:1783 stop:2010 length:228 start_codon:yes stop_codon:yes gene_type:complete
MKMFIQKKIYFLIVYAVSYIIIYPQTAYAYIDPGTTNLIISAIIALFATIGYYFRLIIQRVKELLKKIKSFFTKQ